MGWTHIVAQQKGSQFHNVCVFILILLKVVTKDHVIHNNSLLIQVKRSRIQNYMKILHTQKCNFQENICLSKLLNTNFIQMWWSITSVWHNSYQFIEVWCRIHIYQRQYWFIIGSGNGLLSVCHQAITWTSDGLLSKGPSVTNFSAI